jgi:hypothetical protein
MKIIKEYSEFVLESIPKNKWIKTDPIEYDDELISLVQNAYKNTPDGSFINTKRDAVKSEWLSIDIDEYPELDATIFYRGPRENEAWIGKKLQGIGHDGSIKSIGILLNKLNKLLNDNGIWIEASDQLEKILYKMNIPYVNDEELAKQIFPNSELKFIGDKGKYDRIIKSKGKIETIFGKPILKDINESLKDKLKGKSEKQIFNLFIDKDLSDITNSLYDIYKKNPPIELIYKISDKFGIPKNFNKITIIDILDAMDFIQKYKEPHENIKIEDRVSYIRSHQLNSIENKHTYVTQIYVGSGYLAKWCDIRVLPKEEEKLTEYLNKIIKNN